ncbi:MAG: hypothetical protein GY854_26980, partial [Deltaproteobacteria bacterium]|nr:hypothetical protein [Deltaproteobacteria bacterium]
MKVTDFRLILGITAIVGWCCSEQTTPAGLTADSGVDSASNSDYEPDASDNNIEEDAGDQTEIETIDVGDGDSFLTVINRCPFPIWSHVIGFDLNNAAPVSLHDGQAVEVPPAGKLRYEGVPWVGGGRVYGYYQAPPAHESSIEAPLSPYNQFVEMTFDDGLNYNISYVDYAALPVSMKGGLSCPETTCALPLSDWSAQLDNCPTERLRPHNGTAKCMASYNYCVIADRNTADEYCTKMAVYGHSGTEIYGGYFPDKPSEDVAFWDG